MRNEFAVRALKRLKQMENTKVELKKIGVDLTELEDGGNLLEEAIAVLFSKTDQEFEQALKNIQDWLSGHYQKTITAEIFVQYLETGSFGPADKK